MTMQMTGQAETAAAQEAPHMLLCTSHVKAYIKARAGAVRPGWQPTQVSDEAVQILNCRLKKIIDESLRRHPARGVTFNQIT